MNSFSIFSRIILWQYNSNNENSYKQPPNDLSSCRLSRTFFFDFNFIFIYYFSYQIDNSSIYFHSFKWWNFLSPSLSKRKVFLLLFHSIFPKNPCLVIERHEHILLHEMTIIVNMTTFLYEEKLINNKKKLNKVKV